MIRTILWFSNGIYIYTCVNLSALVMLGRCCKPLFIWRHDYSWSVWSIRLSLHGYGGLKVVAISIRIRVWMQIRYYVFALLGPGSGITLSQLIFLFCDHIGWLPHRKWLIFTLNATTFIIVSIDGLHDEVNYSESALNLSTAITKPGNIRRKSCWIYTSIYHTQFGHCPSCERDKCIPGVRQTYLNSTAEQFRIFKVRCSMVTKPPKCVSRRGLNKSRVTRGLLYEHDGYRKK